MKVIDLLNKITNGEEIPKKIEYCEVSYSIMEHKIDYYNDYYEDYFIGDILRLDRLNDEVKILEEEKKIPEKINIYEDGEGHYFKDKHCKKIYITCDEMNFMVEEFNQIIDYLKSKGE